MYRTVNSPLTAGLISGAIAEFGIWNPYDPDAATLAENYHNLTTAYSTATDFLAYANVTTIAELRQLPMDDIIVALQMGPAAAGSGPDSTATTTTTFNFGPTLDFYAAPAKYIDTLKTGPTNDVPFITGNTKDESGAST